jgi:hypothetical protein
MTAILFPKEWATLKSLESPQEYDHEFDTTDVEHGFDKLLHSHDLLDKYRFCFFIDGLDELQETTSEDHPFLVDLLNEWVAIASGALKICVTSREDNVFIADLDSSHRISLQDLTKGRHDVLLPEQA